MRSLVVGISSHCEFAESLIDFSFELGHVVYVRGGLSEPLSKLTEDLKIPQLEEGLFRYVDIYVSSYMDQEHIIPGARNIFLSISESWMKGSYDVCWLERVNGELIVLEETNFSLEKISNGADRYKVLQDWVVRSLGEIILQLSQGSSLNRMGRVKKLPDQVDLNKLKFWHRSNENNSEPYQHCGSIFDEFSNRAINYRCNYAICFEGELVTYEQLYTLSKQAARLVQTRLSIKKDNEELVVALALHKSVELYAFILGVLSLGGVYVPIDPDYPEERTLKLLEMSKPSVLIKDKGLSFLQNRDFEVLDVEGLRSSFSSSGDGFNTKEVRKVEQAKPAVLIYTSGSTGVPKGVQLSHDNILNFCEWYKRYVDLGVNSRVLQFSTVCFDAALLDIFPTLLTGGCLIVPNLEQRHDYCELDRLIVSNEVTHSFLPPAMLGSLPEYDWPSLSHIVTGGDVCDIPAIERWSKGRFLYNFYGPSECTVVAAACRFNKNSNNKVIGRPVSNTKVYILDERLQPVSTGEHGELYISGDGVGLGYYNEPEATVGAFIQDPVDDNAGKMMYRSGDICYWDSSGNLNFVGRKDNQLKIRGFRVELGEIENAVLESGIYRKCIVLATGKKQIRAFVADPSGRGDTGELRKSLAKVLPDYMLPAHIVEVDQFPSTINGKVDRSRLLGIPVESRSSNGSPMLTATEQELRKIWANTLDLDEVDIGKSDSFFDLGGHSLLVSKMLLLVKNQFDGIFTLARFMENPTLEGLSYLLTNSELQKGDQIPERIYADIILDGDIQIVEQHNENCFSPKAVLLTGANGFLGTHILGQLISETDAIVYCLVRAESEGHAYSKLQEACRMYNVSACRDQSRIRTILGDLSMPMLGLSAEKFSELAIAIDTIYHNGAQVNHIYSYQHLYQTNVQSTLDLLRLATTKKNKQFVYVSTLSAASNVDSEGRVIEDGPAGGLPIFVNNGYNLSKWVSEHLIWQAYARGLPVTIVRPGNICGHSETGHCYPDQNRILLLLKGCAQLGYAPNWTVNFDLSPVDFIAEAIVACTTAEVGHVPVLHLHNPLPLQWANYVGRLNHHNVPIQLIPEEQWRPKLLKIDEGNALFNVVSFYIDERNEDISDISIIDYSETLNRLRQVGICYPEKNSCLIDSNLGFLVRSGFIEQESVLEVI